MSQTYFILDTETASLEGGVVEIAWLEINSNLEVVSEFVSRVNPERPIEPGAQAVHGISDADVADKPTLKDIATRLPKGIKMIAHNVPFDLKMVQEHIEVEATLCTLALARRTIPSIDNHKLSTLATTLGLDTKKAHSALGDCYLVLGLLRHLIELNRVTLHTSFTRQHLPKIVHRMPFGKFKGRFTMHVPSDYRRWLLGQSNVDKDIVYTFKMLEKIK